MMILNDFAQPPMLKEHVSVWGTYTLWENVGKLENHFVDEQWELINEHENDK